MLVKRSWGHYLTLISRAHFKVKLLRFHRNGELSMQRHRYRSELWCFLSGGGIMIKSGSWSMAVSAGIHYLAQEKEWHKFVASRTTWVLEIQYGERCVEEDIERT